MSIKFRRERQEGRGIKHGPDEQSDDVADSQQDEVPSEPLDGAGDGAVSDERHDHGESESASSYEVESRRGFSRLLSIVKSTHLPPSRRGKVLLALIMGVAVSGVSGLLWWKSTELPDNAAFRIGDHVVTVDDLNREVDKMRALYGVQQPNDKSKLAKFHRDTAKSFAVGLVLDQAAQDEGVTISEKTARDALTRFVSRQHGSGKQARQQFVDALGEAGTNEKSVLSEIKRQLATSQLFERVSKDVTVSNGEVRAAFEKRKDKLGNAAQREIQNIVVSDKGTAAELVKKLDSGAKFETLAKRYSLDSSTRDKGGNLGKVSAEQLQDDYAKVAFSASSGDIFGPVKTEDGWNVGRVNASVPAVPADFEKSKQQLKRQLELEKSVKTWRRWLQEKIRNADIHYADSYRPANPDALPQGPTTGKGSK